MNRVQAALKIQTAWRKCTTHWANACPYCDAYGCGGIYSEFRCPEMWEKSDLAKLDAYLDRFND